MLEKHNEEKKIKFFTEVLMLSFKRTKTLGTILRKSCLTKVAEKCFHKKCSHLGACS